MSQEFGPIAREIKENGIFRLEDATPEEITEAKKNWHHHRVCDHTLVHDTDLYPYWARFCAICGKSLGLV
jgi:hypothetical protein